MESAGRNTKRGKPVLCGDATPAWIKLRTGGCERVPTSNTPRPRLSKRGVASMVDRALLRGSSMAGQAILYMHLWRNAREGASVGHLGFLTGMLGLCWAYVGSASPIMELVCSNVMVAQMPACQNRMRRRLLGRRCANLHYQTRSRRRQRSHCTAYQHELHLSASQAFSQCGLGSRQLTQLKLERRPRHDISDLHRTIPCGN